MARLTIRIDFEDGSALGPGKVRLLELIADTGSIRKAAAGMTMSYRKAGFSCKPWKGPLAGRWSRPRRAVPKAEAPD